MPSDGEREGSIDWKAQRAPVRDAGSTPAASTELVDACDRYLAGRHVTLWGFLRVIHEPADRRVAAEWLAAQVAGVLVEKAAPTGWSDLGLVGGK